MDLNADVGEGVGSDEELIPLVTSVNVACGAHAGDSALMERALRAAAGADVAVGAHPGYYDREGFGRRVLDVAPEALEAAVRQQIRVLASVARAHGRRLVHVKPHGALYHRMAEDPATAEAVCRAVSLAEGELLLVGPASAPRLRETAAAHRLRFAAEGFADRRYDAHGRLRPRTAEGALLTDAAEAAEQAVRLARQGGFDTLCIHGDTPGAPAIARAVREALERAGVRLAPLGAP